MPVLARNCYQTPFSAGFPQDSAVALVAGGVGAITAPSVALIADSLWVLIAADLHTRRSPAHERMDQ